MDFNDSFQKDGPDAVRAAFDAAQAPPPDANDPEADQGWPTPEPLPDSLLPVKAFDMDLLPDSLRPWVEDIVQRTQCPVDFVVVTVIVALAIVIGRRVGIRPRQRDNWTEYANLWACIVGRPGTMKSPAMSAALTMLRRLDAEAYEKYAQEKAEYEKQKHLYNLRVEARDKKAASDLKKNPGADFTLEEFEEPVPPVQRRFLVNDTTVEALAVICQSNPQGVGVYRDELVSLMNSLEREGQEGARGFYLTGWSGDQGYIVDRIGRGLDQRIEAVCLSLIGSTQPGRIADYLLQAVKGGMGDDGLVQRFGLMVWPDTVADWKDIDRFPDSVAKQGAWEVFKNLADADPIADWGAVTDDHAPTPFIRIGPEALDLFQEWRHQLEAMLRAGDLHPALESHFAKYRKLVPAMALILHLADGGVGDVSEAAMLRALGWADYLSSHARRAYAAVTHTQVDAAKALLRRIRKGDLAGSFTLRDVYNKNWSHLSTAEAAREATTMLCEYGWLRREKVETGGRPQEVYKVRPGVAA